MKKAIFKGFAVAALALAVLFTGCKNEPSNIETISADAVELTVKAMPGYNYIAWTMPEKFQGSKVMIYRDDGTASFKDASGTAYDGATGATGAGYCIDDAVQDGVTYVYTAYIAPDVGTTTTPGSQKVNYQYTASGATTLTDISTDVKGVIYTGNSVSASVKAINPIVIKDGKLMKAIELCDFEDGGNSDFVINEDNIVVEFNEFTGKYDIAFPTKAYLKYVTKLYKGNVIETFGLRNAGTPEALDGTTTTTSKTQNASKVFYTNDAAVRYDGPVTTAGEYTVVVEVSAVNQNYTTSVIKAKNKFTVKELTTSGASGTPVAGYIDEGKTIRVLWTPAKKVDTTLWSEENYKVYVKDTNTGVYTEIAPAKKAKVNEEGEAVEDDDGNVIMETSLAIAKGLQKNEDVYYIDYAVADNKVGYTFYVVLSDGDLYERTPTANSNKAEVNAYADIPVVSFTPVAYNGNNEDTANVYNAFYNIDNDEQTNDAVLTVKANASGVATVDLKTVKAKYKVIAKSANNAYLGLTDAGANALWLDTEFTDATAVPATDFTRYDFIVKNVAADSEVIWLYEVSQTNKKSKFFTYSANGTSGINAITTSDTTVSVRTNGATADELKANPKVTITVLPIDNPTASAAQQTQNNYANYTWKIYYAKKNVAASTQGKFKSYDDITSWSDGPAVTIAWNKDDAKFEFVKKDFELVVDTPFAEANADNYADTGAKKTSQYKDTYVFKIVKTNKNAAADATGNSVIFYQEYTYTKNAN